MSPSTNPLHIQTPLIELADDAKALPGGVFLKMENRQPIGSFKLRGIGHACQHYAAGGAQGFVASSGGNAGLAVAYSGRMLGLPVRVVVPTSTSMWMRQLIEGQGAEVIQYGDAWDDAHQHAQGMLEGRYAYIHPFDDPVIWEGHASLVHEVVAQGSRPDAVVVAVGGGGLLCGVMEGMHDVGWSDIPVLAVETEGTASFAASVAAGKVVELDCIDSVATTLGAKRVTAKGLDWYEQHSIIPWQTTDASAIRACLRFADEQRSLVEPSCGAALSSVYLPAPELANFGNILVIVCGGAGVNLSLLEEWRAQYTGDNKE